MFGARRLAKRSIIGTRVSALSAKGGHFYEQGVIQSTLAWPNGEEVYTVSFVDGTTCTLRDADIVGVGFRTVASTQLAHGQRVYITHAGREVSGSIHRASSSSSSQSSSEDDEDDDASTKYVRVRIFSDGGEVTVSRRLEDVRLMPSRKSARLQDQDYNRLADTGTSQPDTPKKRAVSHVIDVPTPPAKYSRRRKSASPGVDEAGSVGLGAEDEVGCVGLSGDAEAAVMDEHMAALVLTSLSCSPASPTCAPNNIEKGGASGSPLMFGSSVGWGGVWGGKSSPQTPSPPSQLSRSAPMAPVFSASSVDEGIVLDETKSFFLGAGSGTREKEVKCVRTVYRCTWPGCENIYNTCSAIEIHVRSEHLGPSSRCDSDTSDHEEEFYYTEIAVSVDTVTQSFAEMHTSTEGVQKDPVTPTDHDYQKKEMKSAPRSIPSVAALLSSDLCLPHGTSLPVAVGPPGVATGLHRSYSWQTPSQMSPRASKFHDRLQQHQSASPKSHHFLPPSPKSSPAHKKSRTEVKKCRKVYGMENRDSWCTQCKWKKACSRFSE